MYTLALLGGKERTSTAAKMITFFLYTIIMTARHCVWLTGLFMKFSTSLEKHRQQLSTEALSYTHNMIIYIPQIGDSILPDAVVFLPVQGEHP